MDAKRWEQIKEIYDRALDLSREERESCLAEACAGDADLRREVESLLAAHEDAGTFLQTPAVKVAAREIVADEVTSTAPQLIGRELANYRIVSLLGKGGMGEVYLAEDKRLHRKVALKLLPAEFTTDAERVRRFMQEAEAASALNHPNIITVHDIGESETGRFIVMELVAGRTLRAVIAEDNTTETLLALGGQMAKALSAAHAAGITHRDIKPDNIMVRDDGYVKVLDFGLARLVPIGLGEEAVTMSPQTTPGQLMGTVKYMSPEQARGETVSHPSDVFSLGLIFYELATGQHPFNAPSVVGLLNAVIAETPVPPARLNPQLSVEMERLILRMLRKEARLRPTAAEVVAALREIEIGGGRTKERYGEGESLMIAPSLRSVLAPSLRHTVGREQERLELRTAFNAASAGRGSLLCVSGEPGIGKTTLVEDFLSELPAEGQSTIARGRCSERLAGTEAYLPLLEALENLFQSGSNPVAMRVMKQIAPTWYAQVVPLSGADEESARLLAEVKAASQERMKRELGVFLQEVSRLRPLVLFFDDLHWADVSTIDLLSFLAGKVDTLNVLIVVTYRPSDMLLAKHPFLHIKPDLQARGVCHELKLEFLNQEEIEQYLALEFPQHRFPAELHKLIHVKTEGSPLFMADLVRYLRDHNVIAQTSGVWVLEQSLPDIERELPESVRGMIERKIAQLSEEDHKLLTAASVQGYEFDSAVVAQALKLEPDEAEERLEKLERIYAFVRLVSEEEFPNRTLTLRYRFVHVLYQNALYASLRATRRATLSGTVAQSLLGFYGGQSRSIAAELAALFETARDFAKSAEYFAIAAQNAAQIFANAETTALARRGLEMLKSLPDTPERTQQEFALQFTLGLSLAATRGWGAPEVEQAYGRARNLCRQLVESQQLFMALAGLLTFYVVRGEFETARELGETILDLARKEQNPTRIVFAHFGLGVSLRYLGELVAAKENFESGISLYHPERDQLMITISDPGVGCCAESSRNLWLLGYPDQALKRTHQAMALARHHSHPSNVGFTLLFGAIVHQLRGEAKACQEQADMLIAHSQEKDIADYLAWAMIWRGWALTAQERCEEGIAQIREGLAACRAVGAECAWPEFIILLTESLAMAGQLEEVFSAMDEALNRVQRNRECSFEAELYRLRGELLLMGGASVAEAEQCFHQAIEIARRQSAKSLELRAATSIARLWQWQSKPAEARQMLAEIYGWFTEGFDSRDLKDAKGLLDELQ